MARLWRPAGLRGLPAAHENIGALLLEALQSFAREPIPKIVDLFQIARRNESHEIGIANRHFKDSTGNGIFALRDRGRSRVTIAPDHV